MKGETLIIGYAIGDVLAFILIWAFNIAKYCIEVYPETRDYKEIVDYMFDDTDDTDERMISSIVSSLVWPITIPVFILFLIVLILTAIGSSLGVLIAKAFAWFKQREEKQTVLED